MIEVNLKPGDARKRRRRRSLSLPSVGGLPTGDRWVVGAGVLAVVAILGIGWLFLGVAGQAEELEVQIQTAEADSARLAEVIQRAERLQARGDSIARRVDVIQQIDGSRYVWPHIMDQVAQALPDFTWLTGIQQVSGGDRVAFSVDGRAGTYFALTSFMEAMEASYFIRGTRLIASEQVSVALGGGAERLVYAFTLEAEYQAPPPEMVNTEPLFAGSVAPPSQEED